MCVCACVCVCVCVCLSICVCVRVCALHVRVRVRVLVLDNVLVRLVLLWIFPLLKKPLAASFAVLIAGFGFGTVANTWRLSFWRGRMQTKSRTP